MGCVGCSSLVLGVCSVRWCSYNSVCGGRLCGSVFLRLVFRVCRVSCVVIGWVCVGVWVCRLWMVSLVGMVSGGVGWGFGLV